MEDEMKRKQEVSARPRPSGRCRDRMTTWRRKSSARAAEQTARRTILSEDQIQRLIAAANPRMKLVIAAMASRGLRHGEVSSKFDPEHRDHHFSRSRAAQARDFGRLAKARGHKNITLHDLRRHWLSRQKRPPR